jgi:hypothetical protein
MNRLAHPAQRVAPRRAYLFLATAALATLVALTISVSAARAVVQFSGGPGFGPPPPTLGPYAITPFPDDTRAVIAPCPFAFLPTICSTANNVSSVPAPPAAQPFSVGDVFFSPSLSHRDIPVGWNIWGHGYTGDVYVRVFQTFPVPPFLPTGQPPGNTATMFLPPGTKAFRFYAMTGNGAAVNHFITATTNTGATSGALPVGNIFTGARFYGFFTTTPGETIAFITVTGPAQVNPTVGSFAIGEFGMNIGFAAQLPCPPEPIMAPCHGPSGGF